MTILDCHSYKLCSDKKKCSYKWVMATRILRMVNISTSAAARVYKVAVTLIFFPTRRGTLIFSPNPNLAPRPLNIGKSYIFIAYLGSLKLILLNSIKRAKKNSKKGSDLIYFPQF